MKARVSTTTSAWSGSRSSSTPNRSASSSTPPSTHSPIATPGWVKRPSGRSRSRARCSRASDRSPTTSRSTISSAPRACCCATSTASTRSWPRPSPTGQDRRHPRGGDVPARHAAPGRLEPARGMAEDAGAGARGAGRGRRGDASTAEEPPDITRDTRSFTASIRTRVFAFLRAWSIGHDDAALETIDLREDADGCRGTPSAFARCARPTGSITPTCASILRPATCATPTSSRPATGPAGWCSRPSLTRTLQRLDPGSRSGPRRLPGGWRGGAPAPAPRQPCVARVDYPTVLRQSSRVRDWPTAPWRKPQEGAWGPGVVGQPDERRANIGEEEP